MLILAHAGITLGIAELVERTRAKGGERPAANPWWIDWRLALVGSLLPDIVDKPVGQVLFRDTFSNGRIFCHTLLFLLVIALVGAYLYRCQKKTWLLILSFGTLVHLLLDQMWLAPQTLLWPLYGFAFEKGDLSHWLENILYALHTDPAVYMSELVGAGILIWFALRLVQKKGVSAFIRNGNLFS